MFFILVATTGLMWLLAIGSIYVGTRQEVEGVLDSRLQEAARMVTSLVAGSAAMSQPENGDALQTLTLPGYGRALTCQIWSLDGRLVARSSGAPSVSLSDIPAGFSERLIDGERWRVYTIQNAERGIRVLVGDRLELREHLVTDLLKSLLVPLVLIIPLLGALIWISLSRGLKPLRSLTFELQRRSADDLDPIATGRIPSEIYPVVASLNRLFGKVQEARQHEREITAFAAHELRTPLAGLRMQAQISLAATDEIVRKAALQQILIGVDRTARLVRQLLALARLDAGHDVGSGQSDVNVGCMLDETVGALTTANREVDVIVDSALRRISLTANAELLALAIRNLHENALQHASRGGIVRWMAMHRETSILIAIEDDGPGIPDDELPCVTHRFFRGRYKSNTGSGLGLAIVELALSIHGAVLRLSNRSDRSGLRAEIVWPAARGRIHSTAADLGPREVNLSAALLLSAR